MAKLKKNKVCFPHMGNYYPAFKMIAELMDCEIINTPPISKRTIELGFKNSPESVCIPFKYNLGNYIEALDMGADIILQAGGGCRFGFYAEVQKEILKNLGYKFTLFKLNNNYNPFTVAKSFQEFNPKVSFLQVIQTFIVAYQKCTAIEKVEEQVRLNIGFEVENGTHDRIFKTFLKNLEKTNNYVKIRKLTKEILAQVKNIKLNKPKKPLRVGVVGELYIVMEPFSNFDIEKKLGKKGIEVHRFVTVSEIINSFLFPTKVTKHFLKYARPYLKYHIGAHGLESVAMAHKLAQEGFDGIIHIKPFGCMPEINAMPALHHISQDYHFPIIYFSFDSQTSETGINTRLEAFYDMLVMKREKKWQKKKNHQTPRVVKKK